MSNALSTIHDYVAGRVNRTAPSSLDELRIGIELKFPLVDQRGNAARAGTVQRIWEQLAKKGWELEYENKALVGARKKGECNDTVASVETGHCKPEFSLAHTADLHAMNEQIETLRSELLPICESLGVHLLAYGVHPCSRPHRDLMMKRSRTGVWDGIFGANRIVPAQDGDDVCLFTLNAANHVHVSAPRDQVIRLVNVLNGFSGAQIALSAHSPVWKSERDTTYRCVSEKFWDWWVPDRDRIGVPPSPFSDLRHYIESTASLKPVYVKRNGEAILLRSYDSFLDYFKESEATGTRPEGTPVSVTPEMADIDLHNSCYWHNNRISRYFTVENRTNDQQAPDELLSIAALTLGLTYALDDAEEQVRSYSWDDLVGTRETACARGLRPNGTQSKIEPAALAAPMLDIAERGLKKRDKGEEKYLEPMKRRLANRKGPADDVIEAFDRGGIPEILKLRKWC